MDDYSSRNAGALMQSVLYEVKRIVVGQDHFLERVLVAILAQGHLLVEGVPGLAKTLTVNTLAKTIRGSVQAHSVHTRPAAGRFDRHAHVQPANGRFFDRARPGVHQPAARRRDQSRARQGAERVARSDAGAAGHDRRRIASRA